MSIPWLPKETAHRLLKDHERDHVKATYLLSTAYVAGFLGRDDGRRPCWFNRVRLPAVTSLTPDLQEHLANVCHVICMKLRQEVTSEPGGVQHMEGQNRPATTWQAGLLCARVLWRAIFAAAAAKVPVSQHACPVLFMAACDSLSQAARKLLTRVWLEAHVQFTSKCNKYRNMKSRPPWSVLEGIQYKVYAQDCGYTTDNPAVTSATAGTKPFSNLQDYLEEVLALRFAVDWLAASMQDAQEFIEQSTRRISKRPPPRARPAESFVAQQLAALKEKSVHSFAMMWSDDAELRSVASLAIRLMDGLEGPSAPQFAALFAGQLLLAVWKGVQPLFAHHATMKISRTVETHAAVGTLSPPPLHERDNDSSHTAAFDRVASSYGPPSKDCQDLMLALQRGVLGAIVKVQATFRGYLFRARHFSRARAVAAYCKAIDWPLVKPRVEDEEEELPTHKDKKRRKKPKKVDPNSLNEQIAEFQPTVSKYLGGDSTMSPRNASTRITSPTHVLQTTAQTLRGTANSTSNYGAERYAAPLPTADHRACADLFALYMYNMYRRRELTRMWQTLCGAYERGIGAFAQLLVRNPALKPMLESISAQLKRGSVVGYDKAFIATQRKDDVSSAQGKIKNVEAELFKRKPEKGKTQAASKDSMQDGLSADAGKPPVMGAGGLAPTRSQPMLSPSDRAGKDSSLELTGEYLTNYLKEMDGDDSQFKDISASVIPLSTGTSPPRISPPEFILKAEQESKGARQDESQAGADKVTPKRPRLDVPFCLQRLKPIWLPIKAHRFMAYRAKVLQILPSRVHQQYIDWEKQMQFAACIKLLESATPGSLNVLSPATLVNNKPLLIETVLQLIVGYLGMCMKHNQGGVAVKLITQVLDNISLALRDLHPGHRTILEAYLFDTALSVCYLVPTDLGFTDRAESFFQQASERYIRLNHVNRYCKCCLRAAAVFHGQGNKSEAEYYTQQALNKLADSPVSSLLAVCYHNLAVHTMVQHRVPDATAHVRSYVELLRQLPKLGNSWMQIMDNTQWLILKCQDLWPQFQQQANMRDSSVQ